MAPAGALGAARGTRQRVGGSQGSRTDIRKKETGTQERSRCETEKEKHEETYEDRNQRGRDESSGNTRWRRGRRRDRGRMASSVMAKLGTAGSR
eukprot:6179102-Pleurochrysis_carterae.AAC.2